MRFVAKDPDYERRVRDSFARQTLMSTMGVDMVELGPGTCTLAMDYRRDLCQQHGYHHAGATTALADSAAGYAAYSLMPPGSSVLTVEYKINLMAPAAGERFLARAAVERAGRTITVVRSEVFAVKGGEEKAIAFMLATMMCLADTPDS
ncbi:PaaI family thioesterase [Azospirillum sp.]|uniref:PaaI family thioesterase n=1 Tax=Azospirillum sp. TaxID=34012 RepID=UPI003D738C74